MVLLVGLLWGLNWPAVKFMMTEIQPFTIRAIAFPAAATLLAIVAVLRKQSLRPDKSEFLPLLITSLFLIFAFNMLTSLGQSLTEASRAVIIAYTMPAMTAMLSALYLKERISFRIGCALVTGMLGLGVLISEDIRAILNEPAGLLVMLFAALCWSIGNIALKANHWRLGASALAAWLFGLSALFAWPVAWVLESPASMSLPGSGVLLTLLFHIVCPMVISYQLWTVLLERLPVTVAAISTLTAPIVGVLSAVLFLGEGLGWQKALSLTLIVLSIVITLYKPAK